MTCHVSVSPAGVRRICEPELHQILNPRFCIWLQLARLVALASSSSSSPAAATTMEIDTLPYYCTSSHMTGISQRQKMQGAINPISSPLAYPTRWLCRANLSCRVPAEILIAVLPRAPLYCIFRVQAESLVFELHPSSRERDLCGTGTP